MLPGQFEQMTHEHLLLLLLKQLSPHIIKGPDYGVKETPLFTVT
jgi:hypothetical protein